MLLIAGGTIGDRAPSTTDHVELNGKKWGISRVVTVAPAEQDILYKISIQEAEAVE